MSKEIAIQWSHKRLHVVSGNVQSSSVKIDRAFTIELPAEKTTEQAVAKEVASALKSNGIGRNDVTVVLGRECVEMRQFDVPPVPKDELPELVRMQAGTHFTAFSEDWSLDYVPVKHDQDGMPTTVVAAAVSPQLMKQIKECVEGAGLKIRHITLRGFSSLELANSVDASGCRILTQRTGEELDFTVVNGKDIVLTRTVKMHDSYSDDELAKRVSQEFKRTTASAAHQLGNSNIDHIIVIGNEGDSRVIFEQLKEVSIADVSYADPAAIGSWSDALVTSVDGQTSQFGSVVGALLGKSKGQKHVVDILNPRSRPKAESKFRKLYFYGGLAAALAICAFGVTWFLLNQQEKRISSLGKDLRKALEQTESYPQKLGKVEEIDHWKKADTNWLDELDTISQSSMYPDDMILDVFTGKYVTTKDKVDMVLDGRVLDRDVQEKLRVALLDQNYDVDSGPTPKVAKAEEEYYQLKFKETLTRDLELEDLDLELWTTSALTSNTNESSDDESADTKTTTDKNDKSTGDAPPDAE